MSAVSVERPVITTCAPATVGTPSAADLPADVRGGEFQRIARMIAATSNGLLGCAIADPNLRDDDDHETPAKAGY